jgi:hypothetical protein
MSEAADTMRSCPALNTRQRSNCCTVTPQLAAVLLTGTGVQVPADSTAVLADSNLSVPEPTELRADVVTLHKGTMGKLAVVTEIQKDPPDADKRRAWIAYVALICATQTRGRSSCKPSPISMPSAARPTLDLSALPPLRRFARLWRN